MSTVRWFSTPTSQASAHIVIGRDGKCAQMVPLNMKAWHAGLSQLNGRTGCNEFTIGIELCNWGKLTYKNGIYKSSAGQNVYDNEVMSAPHKFTPDKIEYWEKYTDDQMNACIEVCKALREVYPIKDIVGHDDIATPKGRKVDPGPAFDMSKLKQGLGGNLNETAPITSGGIDTANELMLMKNDLEILLKRVNKILDRRTG